MIFRVDKCHDETNNETCATSEEIDKFIKRVKVETWVVDYKTDFMLHEGIPAVHDVRWLKTDMMDPTIVK